MADITIARQTPVPAGLAPTFTSLNATDVYYVPAKATMLYFKNTNAAPAIITFDVTQTPQGLTVSDPTVSVPATTGERVLKDFTDFYQQVGGVQDGNLKFSCSIATGASVAAFVA